MWFSLPSVYCIVVVNKFFFFFFCRSRIFLQARCCSCRPTNSVRSTDRVKITKPRSCCIGNTLISFEDSLLLAVVLAVWSGGFAVCATRRAVQTGRYQGDGTQARSCCMRHDTDGVPGHWLPQDSQVSTAHVPSTWRLACHGVRWWRGPVWSVTRICSFSYCVHLHRARQHSKIPIIRSHFPLEWHVVERIPQSRPLMPQNDY